MTDTTIYRKSNVTVMRADGTRIEDFESLSCNGYPVDDTILSKNRLYHYTSKKNLLRIVSDGSLKFSEYNGVNDFDEYLKGYEVNLINKRQYDFDSYRKQIASYKQISLCTDYKVDDNTYRKGFANLPMWSHYANHYKGVCIEFDFDKLNLDNYHHDDINYVPNIPGYPSIDDLTPDQFVSNNVQQLFFTKRIEWEYEHEHRIISNNQSSLYIKDAIRGIYIFGNEDIDCLRIFSLLLNSKCISAPIYVVYACQYGNNVNKSINLYYHEYVHHFK